MNRHYMRLYSLQAVDLSQRSQTAVQSVSNPPAPSNGGRYTFFGKPAMRMVGAAPQTHTNESVFVISAINKYMLESRYQ